MSDIIERLRPRGQVIMVSPEFCNEVIDEIERLRDELSDAAIKLENEKIGAEMIYQENDRLMHDCQNFLNEIEQLRAELAEAQAVIEQMHKFAFDRHDAMLDQVVEGIMKDDSALQQRLAQERERCAQMCDYYADCDHANFADRCAEDIRALEEPK